MALAPILEPVAVDWDGTIVRLSGEGAPTRCYHVRELASLMAELFSVSVDPDELSRLRGWIVSNPHVAGSARQALIAMLTRAPIRQVIHGGPDPLRFLEPGDESGSGNRQPVDSIETFPSSELVRSAWRMRAQSVADAKVHRDRIWEYLIEPFARAPKIWLFDPFAIARAHEAPNVADSGLAYYLRRLGELARTERQPGSIVVMSSQPKDRPPLTKGNLEHLGSKLVLLSGGALRIELRLITYPARGPKPAHDRYFLAGTNGNIHRALHLTDSWVADGAREYLRPRLSGATLYTHPDQVEPFERDWRRASALSTVVAVSSRDA